jgi:hypothetical protein
MEFATLDNRAPVRDVDFAVVEGPTSGGPQVEPSVSSQNEEIGHDRDLEYRMVEQLRADHRGARRASALRARFL